MRFDSDWESDFSAEFEELGFRCRWCQLTFREVEIHECQDLDRRRDLTELKRIWNTVPPFDWPAYEKRLEALRRERCEIEKRAKKDSRRFNWSKWFLRIGDSLELLRLNLTLRFIWLSMFGIFKPLKGLAGVFENLGKRASALE